MENIDNQEIARFSSQAGQWWDTRGKFKALHQINPVRVAYVIERAGVAGHKILDVGCGGGLLSEAMAAAGGQVTGIDMAASALEVAGQHAEQSGLDITYRKSTAEEWARSHADGYDVVTCMELVEHVPDPAGLVMACSRLLRSGGSSLFCDGESHMAGPSSGGLAFRVCAGYCRKRDPFLFQVCATL
jgi:2-polyprenyl-6-hydroxyphenyl methylase/3-demethylubiquinone-9 3-methyltransferase